MPIGSSMTPAPWALPHNVTLFRQVRQRPGDVVASADPRQYWADTEPTSLALAVCNCGLNTGWIDQALMPDQATLADGDQHAALMAQAVPIGSLHHPAYRDAVLDLLRREARAHPGWIRDLLTQEERVTRSGPRDVIR